MIDELLRLTPTQSEHAIADLLRERGFQHVQRVGGAGDLGVDLIAHDPHGSLVAIQCKRYALNRPIGSPAIQTFFGMIVRRHAERGIFATTSRYTAGAVKLANELDIELIDGHELARYYAVKRQREWEEQERRRQEQMQAQQALAMQRDAPTESPSSAPVSQSAPLPAKPPPQMVIEQLRTRNPILAFVGVPGLVSFYLALLLSYYLGAWPWVYVADQAADAPPTQAVASATARPTSTPRPRPTPTRIATAKINCDPAYPTVCIPPPPPYVGCEVTTARNFPVLAPDPQMLDPDLDGIGCEPIAEHSIRSVN